MGGIVPVNFLLKVWKSKEILLFFVYFQAGMLQEYT